MDKTGFPRAGDLIHIPVSLVIDVNNNSNKGRLKCCLQVDEIRKDIVLKCLACDMALGVQLDKKQRCAFLNINIVCMFYVKSWAVVGQNLSRCGHVYSAIAGTVTTEIMATCSCKICFSAIFQQLF